MTRTHLPAALSLFLASIILMSSLHLAQIAGSTDLPHDMGKKISYELHHHSDKSGAQLIKDASDSQAYLDARSLRHMRDHKKEARNRLARWQRAWQDFSLIVDKKV